MKEEEGLYVPMNLLESQMQHRVYLQKLMQKLYSTGIIVSFFFCLSATGTSGYLVEGKASDEPIFHTFVASGCCYDCLVIGQGGGLTCKDLSLKCISLTGTYRLA